MAVDTDLLSVQVVRHRGDVTVAHVRGELDVVSGPVLAACLAQCAEAAPRRLVVDLAEVSFMGSYGVAALAATAAAVHERPTELVLAGVARRGVVRRVVEISRLDTLMPVVDSVADVLPVAMRSRGADPG